MEGHVNRNDGPASPRSDRRTRLGSVLRGAMVAYVAVSGAAAAMLTGLLVWANWSSIGIVSSASLFLAMLWIALLINGLFLLPVLATWPVVSRLAGRGPANSPRAYFLSGLVALNVYWILWHRLGMVHQWLSVRPFMSVTGLAENLVLLLAMITAWGAVFRLRVIRRAYRSAVALATITVVLIGGVLYWNSSEERYQRVYALETVRSAAGPGPNSHGLGSRGSSGPVIILGIDGFTWNVAVPLMRTGRLPGLRRIVRDGAIGYLSNGDESYSPSIWTTIYTGRPTERHGIHGYFKMVVLGTKTPVTDLLRMRPSLDSFYGLSHALKRLPTAGLWRMEQVGTADRLVPAIWEVASHYHKHVVVVTPIVSAPVRPVNGALVDLTKGSDAGGSAYYPEELAKRWGRQPTGELCQTEESFSIQARRFVEEVSFTVELFREHDIDMGIYYTHFVDTVSHLNWDFYARDRFFLTDLPWSLDDRKWERLVDRYADDRVFRVYSVVDEQIQRLVDAFPSATFVIVSDHGWTYSGYEHFGSPDGVVVFYGPTVRRGAYIRDAHILDIAPTTLALLGVPLSEEMEGRLLSEAFDVEIARRWVPSYGEELLTSLDEEKPPVSKEEQERLRALGYVD